MAQDKTYIEIGSNIPANGTSATKNPSGVAAMNIQINAGANVTSVIEGVLADIQGAEQPQESDWVEVTRFIGPGIFPLKNVPSLFRVKALGGPIDRARAMGYRDPKAVPETIPASLADITSAVDPIVDPIRTTADAAQALAEQAINIIGRVAIDATLYGVAEDAPAQTLMDAIAATPNGGTLVCPKVKLIQTPTCSLWLIGRPNCNITIQGNGLRIEADPTMSDNTGTQWPECRYKGGFLFYDVSDLDIYDLHYDGRLDARTPVGGDGSGVGGPRCGWQFTHTSHRIRLWNCSGNRCMMDGAATGPLEDQYRPAGYPAFQHGVDIMPTDIELHNFVARYNYRQGISPCGSHRLWLDGGEYAYTGQLGAGKGTSPMAGMCWEAYLPLDWRNTEGRITGNPQMHHNVGLGLSVENATQGLRMDSGHIYENGGGISVSATGTMDNEITGTLVERNGVNSPVPIDVQVAGFRNHFHHNTVKSLPGVAGIAAGVPGGRRNISNNTVIALQPQAGKNGGYVQVFGGGICYMDLKTGKGLGWDGNNQPIGYEVTYPADTVSENRLEDALAELGGAIHVESKGAHVTRNRVHTSVADPARNCGVSVYYPEGLAERNDVRGYEVPIRTNAPGEHLARLPAPYFNINKADSVALSGYTAADYAKKVALLSDDPDVLRYEVQWTVVYDAVDADRLAKFDLAPTQPGGRKWIAVSVSARSDAGPVATWREGSAGSIIAINVPRAFSVITVTTVVEVRRA